jgi:Tfp pilus assembly protein FimT
MPKNNQLLGFTLTEMLITVGITALLTALAAPSFISLLEKRRLTAAAEAILADLRMARSEAIKRNISVTVSFTEGNAGLWQYTIDALNKSVDSGSIQEFANTALTTNLGTSGLLTGFGKREPRPRIAPCTPISSGMIV